MKHFFYLKSRLLLMFFLCLMAGSVSGQVTSNDVEQGVVRVKFKRHLTATLNQMKESKQAGVLSIGIAAFDKANKAVSASSMKRVFPYSPKYDARHRKHGLDLWYDVYYNESINPLSAITAYQSAVGADIEMVEPVYKKRLIDGKISPYKGSSTAEANLPFNDRLLKNQWHYNNDGQVQEGIAEADINLFDAWKTQTGTSNVIVCVVDGGIDIAHADLKDNLWVNTAELNGKAGVDDDGNGYIDDVHGFNFIYDINNITAHHHGTHVAGTVAAVNNNGIGVCGVAGGSGKGDGARLMSTQVFDENNGSGGFAEAIVYGADNGAVISQNSWGYLQPNIIEQSVLDAIDYFVEEAGQYEGSPMKGGIVIFAAGNDGVDLPMYPGYYDKTFCVGALGANNTIAYYSNYGSWVDISAPGGDQSRGESSGILSTLPGNSYGYLQGTSMACPHVSGVAALAVSQHGGSDFTADELRLILESSTHDVDRYNPNYAGKLGVGYIDAAMTLKSNQGISPNKITDLKIEGISQDFVTLSWTVPADEDDGYPANFQVFYSKEPITNDNFLKAHLASLNNAAAAGEILQYDLIDLKPLSTYYFVVRSMDRWANKSDISNVVSGTTNAGPDINLPDESLDFVVTDADNFKLSSSFTVENLDEGILKWEGLLRHRDHQLSYASATINYPKPAVGIDAEHSKIHAVARRVNNQITKLEQVQLNEFNDQIDYGDGDVYVIGDSERKLTCSSATRYLVTSNAGFNLTNVSMVLGHNPETGNMVMEIFKGALNGKNLIYAQEVESFVDAVYDHDVQLDEQLFFEQGETFWIVFHVPQGNTYCLGAVNESSAEYSDNCFMSFDVGKSWVPLASIVGDKFAWSTKAISHSKYLGEYIELLPAEGQVTAQSSQEIELMIDATKLINGDYQANILIKSNDSDEKEVRLPVNLNVTGQKPDLRNVSVVDYGSVFYGLHRDLIIPITNFGYGDFANLDASTTDDQFKIIKQNYSIPARDYGYFTVRYTPNGAGNDNGSLILEDDKGNVHRIRLFGVGTPPAEISIAPQSVSIGDMAIGDNGLASFTISNTGEYPLEYKIPYFMMDQLTEPDYSVHKFGYTYQSNQNGGSLNFEWNDIAGLGEDVTDYFTNVSLSHLFYEVDLGFEFPFYGQNLTSINLTRFGALTLDQEGPLGNCFPPFLDVQCAPKGIISAMTWAFDVNRSGSIHYKKEAGKFIVQYTDVFNEEGLPDEKVTFQIVLHQNGDIDYLYKDVEMMYPDDLRICLIGIGDPDYKDAFVINGNKYVIGNYTYGNITENNTIFRIKHPGQNFIESVSKTEGVLGVGESDVIEVNLNTSKLNEGLAYQILSIQSSDPFNPISGFRVEANINSGGNALLSVDRNNLAFGNVFRGSAPYQTLTVANQGNKDVEITAIDLTGGHFSMDITDYPKIVKAKSAFYLRIAYDTQNIGQSNETLTVHASNGESLQVAVAGEVLAEPVIAVDVASIEETVQAGDKVVKSITVTNDGDSPLEMVVNGLDWLHLDVPLVRSLAVPDFMYSWKSSNDVGGPSCEWIDITSDGELTSMAWFSDNEQLWKGVDLPFEFKFYNQPTRKMWFSWQGVITTSTPIVNPPFLAPEEFPNVNEPNNLIAPYFGLHKYNRPGTTNSGVYYKAFEDKVIFQWNNLFDRYGLGIDYSFQAIIYANGNIKFQYQHGDQGWAVVNLGVIGIENSTGTEGVRAAAYQNYFADQLAITFNPGEKQIIPANGSVKFNVALDAKDLNRGVYESNLLLFNNTPNSSRFEIPVTLTVEGKAALQTPASVDFGSVMAYQDSETGMNHEYIREFQISNSGRALLSFNSISLDDDSQTTLEYYVQYRGGYRWIPVPSSFSFWDPCELKPGQSLKLRAIIAPDGESDAITANVVFSSSDLEQDEQMPVTANVTLAPVANLPGDDLKIIANTPQHQETVAVTISNVEGKGELVYDLSLLYNNAEGRSLSQSINMASASKAMIGVSAMSSKILTAESANEDDFDAVLQYDEASKPDGLIGYGEGAAMVAGIAFTTPASGLKLTHVKTWYCPGSLLNSDIEVYILSGGGSLDDADIVWQQTYNHVINAADEKGSFITIPLAEAQMFFPGEKFYIVLSYPLNAANPQGGVKFDNPVSGRYFFPYDGVWMDIVDSPIAQYGFMIKALSDNNQVSSWISLESPASGAVPAGGSVDVSLKVDARFGRDADNFARLVVASNDPVNPVLIRGVNLRMNQGPVLSLVQGQKLTVDENQTLTIQIQAQDVEDDECNYSLVESNNSVKMTVSEDVITLVYTPDYEAAGTNVISVKGVDAFNNTSTLAIEVVVVNVNRIPEVIKPFNELNVVLQQPALRINLNDYFSDPDGDALTYDVITSSVGVVDFYLSNNILLIEPKVTDNITMTVKVADQFGAVLVHDVQLSVVNRVGIDEIEKAGWRIYPNPMDVFVMLSKSSELSSNATVRIFSATGSMVICQDLQAAAGGEFMLKVSHLAAGVYFLELDENNQKLVFKLVKK